MEATDAFTIRKMTLEEVESIAIEWAAKEGWNPGIHDAESFYLPDPNGFLVGLLNDQPIACISAVAYNEDFGFIGFYIVHPEFRGLGYGIQMWKAAMEHLQNRNIGLDGVFDQQENYQKSGFKLAYSNIRYEGIAGETTVLIPEVQDLSSVPFEKVLKYDGAVFPVSRPEFLKSWIQQKNSLALGIMNDSSLAGYGVIRKCRTGYKIGPLFADSTELAKQLFLSLCNFAIPDTPIFIDIPEPNEAAIKFAEDHSMKRVFGTARMYSKFEPAIDLNKIFGVTSFELG